MGNTSKEIMVTELLRKRAELTGALERNEAEKMKIVADIGTVDSALFMFAPDIQVDKIVPKQLPPIFPAGRGQMTLLALHILRDARAPVSTQDLNILVMKARNLNVNDAKLTDMMRVRLHSSLRNHRAHKRVRSMKSADGKFSLWEISR